MRKTLLILSLSLFSLLSYAQQSTTDSCGITLSSTLSIKNKDTLKLFCDCGITEFSLVIYNRWGIKMLETAKIVKPNYISWDYSSNTEGVYVWILKYTAYYQDVYRFEKEKTGWTTITK